MADSGLRVYVSLMRMPHVARFAVLGVVGQFPLPLLGMGLLIAVRDGYGSYTLAGTVSSVMALTSAVTGPIVGRLVDAHGQRNVGLPIAALWLASIGVMSAVLALRLPAAMVIVGGVLLGTSVPFSSMLRARWRHVLVDRPGRLNSALSLTSILEELMWLIGNPLATILATGVAVLSPMAAAAVALVVGVVGFLLDSSTEPPAAGRREPRRRGRAADDRFNARRATGTTERAPGGNEREPGDNEPTPDPRRPGGHAAAPAQVHGHGAKEPLVTAGYLSLLGIMVAYGAFIAATNISIVALATELGRPGSAGAVIACFSGASMLGALGYGARNWGSPLWVRFYVGLAVVTAGASALLWVDSLTAAAIVLAVAGMAHAPTVVNVNQLLIRMTPVSRFTEATALLGAMFVIGMAVSNLVAGRMVDAMGSRGGFMSIVAFASGALLIGLASIRAIRAARTPRTVPAVKEPLGGNSPTDGNA